MFALKEISAHMCNRRAIRITRSAKEQVGMAPEQLTNYSEILRPAPKCSEVLMSCSEVLCSQECTENDQDEAVKLTRQTRRARERLRFGSTVLYLLASARCNFPIICML